MPKIVDHEQYRQKLLSQCFDLFAQKGYASITMRQVAQELGVSTGTLYHYFSSKEALFEQLVEQITQQDLLSAIHLKNLPTLAERIEALFSFVAQHEDYFNQQMLIWMDFYQQQDSEKIRQNTTFHRLNEQIRQAIAQLLDSEDPQLAIFVLSLIEGLIQERLFDANISLSKQGELLGKMLTAYLELDQKRTST